MQYGNFRFLKGPLKGARDFTGRWEVGGHQGAQEVTNLSVKCHTRSQGGRVWHVPPGMKSSFKFPGT